MGAQRLVSPNHADGPRLHGSVSTRDAEANSRPDTANSGFSSTSAPGSFAGRGVQRTVRSDTFEHSPYLQHAMSGTYSCLVVFLSLVRDMIASNLTVLNAQDFAFINVEYLNLCFVRFRLVLCLAVSTASTSSRNEVKEFIQHINENGEHGFELWMISAAPCFD